MFARLEFAQRCLHATERSSFDTLARGSRFQQNHPRKWSVLAMTDNPQTTGAMPQKGSLWRHYKGDIYTVTGECMLEATAEPAVLYQKDGCTPTWARALMSWNETVHSEGPGAIATRIPRFSLVRER